jgi:trimethylamine--corrinoid protein Co-methyltransferase
MNDRAQTRKARTSGRRRGGRAREREQLAAPAFIKREIPFYEFLGEEGIVKLEQQADWIIQEIGLEFRDDPKALEIWKSAGADVKGTRVRLERGMARELCKTAPAEFTQHARNPDRNVRIGGSSQVFAPVYGSPFVRDLEGGRRYGSYQDFENLVKIVSQLPSLHHSGLVIIEPCDLPVSNRISVRLPRNAAPRIRSIWPGFCTAPISWKKTASSWVTSTLIRRYWWIVSSPRRRRFTAALTRDWW